MASPMNSLIVPRCRRITGVMRAEVAVEQRRSSSRARAARRARRSRAGPTSGWTTVADLAAEPERAAVPDALLRQLRAHVAPQHVPDEVAIAERPAPSRPWSGPARRSRRGSAARWPRRGRPRGSGAPARRARGAAGRSTAPARCRPAAARTSARAPEPRGPPRLRLDGAPCSRARAPRPPSPTGGRRSGAAPRGRGTRSPPRSNA